MKFPDLLGPILRSLPSYSSTLYQPAPWLSEALGAIPSESGVSVSERTAITLSAVWTCVNIISSAIASLPLEVYRERDDGVHEKVPDHRIYTCLHDSPNAEDSSYTFRQRMMGSLLLYGNTYAEIQYDGAGRVVALWPWPSSMVQIKLGGERGEYEYIIRGRTVAKEDMVHLRGFSYEGIVGLSPIQNMKRTLGLDVATEIFASHFYKQGARSSGVLMYPGKLGEKGKDNLRESFNRHSEGLSNAHKIMVLEEGAKYQPLTIPQNDAQFLESRKLGRAEIAGIYQVPAMLVPGADEKAATYASAEQMMRVFVDFCLRGWMTLWEQELQRKVLPPGLYCEFDTTEFMRADAKARSLYYRQLWEIGAINAATIAQAEHLDPPDEGERYYIPTNNFAPVDRIDDMVDAKLKPKVAPAPGGGGANASSVPNPSFPNPTLPTRTISNGLKGLLVNSLREIQGWEFFSEKRATAKLKPILRAMTDEEAKLEVLVEVLASRFAQRVKSLPTSEALESEAEYAVSEILSGHSNANLASRTYPTMYFARHAETNLDQPGDDEIIAGWSDEPLNDRGKRQAQALGQALRGRGISRVVSSPLVRSLQTAEIIGQILDLPVLPHEGLKPWNVGSYVGKTVGEAKRDLEKYATKTPDSPVPEGESYAHWLARLNATVRELHESTLKGDKPLVQAHGRTIMALPRILGAPMQLEYPEAGSAIMIRDLGNGFQPQEVIKIQMEEGYQ